MAWWTWALILWAAAASAATLWLGARLSAKVEVLADLAAGRFDVRGQDFPGGDTFAEMMSAGQVRGHAAQLGRSGASACRSSRSHMTLTAFEPEAETACFLTA